MSIAFCIGNGESRLGTEISQFGAFGKIYGCNALHRDYKVDSLVCCDRRMVDEALYSKYTGDIYTRPDWYTVFHTPQVRRLPHFPWQQEQKWQKEFHWGSGTHSINLACHHKHEIVVVLGHDFDTGSSVNNVYKNTNNYDTDTHTPVNPSFWKRQFEILFDWYTNITFILCRPDLTDWSVRQEWQNRPNVLFQSTGDMINDLNIA